MHTAELTFRFSKSRPAEDSAVEAIIQLLTALQRSGQLVFDIFEPFAIDRRAIRVFASIPEVTSFQPAHNDKYVRAALVELRKIGVKNPTIRNLGRDPASAEVCDCLRSSAYILYTDYHTSELPLRCADCFGVVPFYRLRPTADCGNFEDVIFWTRRYRAFDQIWMGSGAGERLTYRQLSDVNSELSAEALEICRTIRRQTGIPAYYYLLRFNGTSAAAERKRRCPKCNGAWLLKEPWHKKFDFCCRRCRLLSNLASVF